MEPNIGKLGKNQKLSLDYYLLSNVMLLVILDGSQYQKSQKRLPWLHGGFWCLLQVCEL